MQSIHTTFKYLAVMALSAFTMSCVSQTDLKSKEDLAIAAGYKVITPKKPDQKAIFEKLPEGRMTQISYSGKSYYVLRDSARQQAYVGGPKQYNAYQQLGQGRKEFNDYEQAKKIQHQDEKYPTNWGGWGGWGAWEDSDGKKLESGNAVEDRRAANGWY